MLKLKKNAKLINSDFLNNLSPRKAKDKIIEKIIEKKKWVM